MYRDCGERCVEGWNLLLICHCAAWQDTGEFYFEITAKGPCGEALQFSSVRIYLLKIELLGAAAFVHGIGFLLQH